MEYPHFLIGITSSKGPFSIAMLDCRSVYIYIYVLNSIPMKSGVLLDIIFMIPIFDMDFAGCYFYFQVNSKWNQPHGGEKGENSSLNNYHDGKPT